MNSDQRASYIAEHSASYEHTRYLLYSVCLTGGNEMRSERSAVSLLFKTANVSGSSMAEVAFVRCLKQVGNSNIVGVKKAKQKKTKKGNQRRWETNFCPWLGIASN